MKFNKILLVSLTLLAIFMLGTVSAADDISSENLTVSEEIDDSLSESPIEEIQQSDESSDEEIVGSDENSQILSENDSGMYLKYENFTIDDIDMEDVDPYRITIKFPNKVSGNLSCYVDNKYIKDKKVTAKTHYIDVDLKENGLLTYGTHEIEMRYSGDDTYSSKTIKENFDITYTLFAEYYEDYAVYGKNTTIELNFPHTENGIINYTVNGKKYSVTVKEKSYTDLTISNLKMGNNTIFLSFKDDNHPLKTVTHDIFAKGEILLDSYEIEYGNDAVFTLMLPQDAKGNLHIFEYGDWNDTTESCEKITLQKVPLKNGNATCTISNLTFGNNYMYAEYDGNDYNVEELEATFYVIPKTEYSKKIWANSTNNNIIFECPNDNTSQITVSVYYLDEEEWESYIINTTTVKNKGKTIVPLPKLEAGEYTIELRYNSEDYNWFNSYDLNVLNDNPNTTVTGRLETEILYGESDIFSDIRIPEYADGELVLIADGKIIDKTSVSDRDFNLSSLTPGIHNIEVQYVNDTYYKSSSIMGNVLVTYFKFYEDDETFYTKVSDDATGHVSLIIDGKSYAAQYLDSNGELYIQIDYNVSFGSHKYEIRYLGDEKYPSETKKGSFEHSYQMMLDTPTYYEDQWIFFYGESNFIIRIPNDGTGSATISIDGTVKEVLKNFTQYPGNYGFLIGYYAPTDIAAGNHTISVSYCDSKYPLKVLEHNFTVLGQYRIIVPYDAITYQNEKDSEISLILPANAKGNLVVDIDGDKKTVKPVNGYAKYSLANLTPGYYDISAYYDGTDYEVDEVHLNEDGSFEVTPKISYNGNYNFGDNSTISVEVQKEAKGKFKVAITDLDDEPIKTATINLVNGKGSLSTSDLPIGDNYFTFEYVGDDFSIPKAQASIFISTNITLSYPNQMHSNENANLVLKSPLDTTGNLTLRMNGNDSKYQLVNGIVTVPLQDILGNLTPGRYYNMALKYKGDKVSYVENIDIYLLKADTNININPQSNSAINVQLANDATGKVLLSINGKDYEQNLSNGKATINVGRLASGENAIVATYSGDSKYDVKSQRTNVADKSKIIASDLSASYNDGSKYSVTIYDVNGKLASGTSVVFKIDGKKVGTAKTNAKGVATLKITQTPKTYKISATALGKTVTKKLTVKQILTLKKVTVKKSAKKLVLTATLKKVKGKYLKNKKIIFKFKGKKYIGKTNKKGVAKVTIPSKVLKKLKVGKKITYQATYVKNTVKKTVKVKK